MKGRFNTFRFIVTAAVLQCLWLGSVFAVSAPAAPSQIVLKPQGHGWVLTDVDGMTLYTYARDAQPGKSMCVEQCAQLWPPFEVDAEFVAAQGWSIVDRPEGTQQLAYDDKPLYRYSIDESAGDTYGEGVQALWAVAVIPLPTPPGIEIQKTLQGYVAADHDRKTLYTPANAVAPESLCVDERCAEGWQPFRAPWAARDFNDWTVFTRTDGVRQWAYNGQPLFRFANDVYPRETQGDGVTMSANAGVAKALVLQPRTPYPEWVTVHATDAGEMLANRSGNTVYTYDPIKLRPRYIGLDVEIRIPPIGPEWVPILAAPEATTPGGNWAIRTLDNGDRQWVYKGKLVYTNARDKTQGSFLGYRHGGNRAWNVIMHSEDALVGTLRPP